MSRLNSIEQECQEVLAVIIDTLGVGRPIHRYKYLDLMGKARAAHIRLTNKEFGCDSGKHSGPCHCPKEILR